MNRLTSNLSSQNLGAVPDPVLTAICEELAAIHQVHMILLYGSRANGSANASSDYDIAAFGPVKDTVRIARPVGDSFLDVFVYPDAVLHAPTEEHLKLRGSHVVLQRDAKADGFLNRIEELFQLGPKPLPADEIAAIKVWAHKMLARVERSDPEGNYRRVWLLTALLEDYFRIRGLWYEGPKKSLRWLKQFDLASHDALCLALEPNASHAALSLVVHRVAGEPNP